MATLKQVEAKPALETKFIGRGWLNKVQSGKNAGVEYINIVLDDSTTELTLKAGESIALWPNKKREGINPNTLKNYQDADYRLSIRLPSDGVAAEQAKLAV